jgi:hypothetical protein
MGGGTERVQPEDGGLHQVQGVHPKEERAQRAPFYNGYIYRELKLGSYMRRQITEARLLSRFKKLFGGPEETIVAIGDFEHRKHRKFKELVKGKGFRTLFRKAGYSVYLVDEFRTSCRCSACGGEWATPKTFRVCESESPVSNRQYPAPWTSQV